MQFAELTSNGSWKEQQHVIFPCTEQFILHIFPQTIRSPVIIMPHHMIASGSVYVANAKDLWQ